MSDRIKANGVHYTPATLADFLAAVTAEVLDVESDKIVVLDPACGDGALLWAFARQWPPRIRTRIVLHGYETDPRALRDARQLLAGAGVEEVKLVQQDFLSAPGIAGGNTQIARYPPGSREPTSLAADVGRIGNPSTYEADFQDGLPIRPTGKPTPLVPPVLGPFDAVIANPPYVRTQVLGAARAQELADRFGLTGRVDLYQAFAKAMANVLRPGGALGLLVPNRFLTVKSGAALRRLLRTEFELAALYDLGDTKLFSAAVLPAVVVARRRRGQRSAVCRFDRVYACRSAASSPPRGTEYPAVLDALRDRQVHGIVSTAAGRFKIERGALQAGGDGGVWSLATADSRRWFQTVQARQRYCFDDVARIRVGIKTTADEVFIRDDWETLPAGLQPESELLRPLATHLTAGRWIAVSDPGGKVLYPHVLQGGKRVAVDLRRYPRALAYLETHRQRLSRRKYVIEAGRQWYEIWVPHHPADWAQPKIVFPDIAEEPRFFLDSSGALVNGDCYWMTLRPGFDPAWLYLVLGIANSSFITRYYDLAFHNKLYAGRRRFMTQYVRRFPLPDPSLAPAGEIIELVAQLVRRRQIDAQTEARIDGLAWRSFGLTAG